MNDSMALTPNWTRQLADLRTRALRAGLRRPGAESALGDVLEDALTTWGALLKDFAVAKLNCERLRIEVDAQATAWQHLFDVMPDACLVTDGDGIIRNANPEASRLMHLSVTHLKSRQLFMFIVDRDALSEVLRRLGEGHQARRTLLTIRPRDRRPIKADVRVIPVASNEPLWLWFFAPRESPRSEYGDEALLESARDTRCEALTGPR